MLIAISWLATGQNSEKKLYNWFDSNIGIENTSIFQGIKYEEKNQPLKKKHSFFISNKFIKGNLLYNGEFFFDIKMKYDLFDQELVILFEKGNNNRIAIQLFKKNITEFSLHNTHFIKLKINDEPNFYEEGYKSNLIGLYIKHRKTKRETQYRGKLINSYRNNSLQYFIYYNSLYIKISSRKTIVNIFPEQKQLINSFFKENNSLKKEKHKLFLIDLINSINKNILKSKVKK